MAVIGWAYLTLTGSRAVRLQVAGSGLGVHDVVPGLCRFRLAGDRAGPGVDLPIQPEPGDGLAIDQRRNGEAIENTI